MEVDEAVGLALGFLRETRRSPPQVSTDRARPR